MVVINIRTPRDVGALIKARRRALGLSQADLATKLGVSRLWITQIEQGKPRASLVLVLQAISALGLELTTDDEGRSSVTPKAFASDALTLEMSRRRT